MSNKKQTAVEWLVEQYEKYYVFRDLKNTIVYQQAKEIEKEQMKEMYLKGIENYDTKFKQTNEKNNI
jgi:hypothetical protein